MKQEIKDIESAYIKIGFAERYSNMSYHHSYEHDGLENYSNEEVENIFSDLGYNSKYFKSENYFRVEQKKDNLNVSMNLSMKYGVVELILIVRVDGEMCKPVGPMGKIYRSLGNSERLPKPKFCDYNELKTILLKGLSIYEDIFSLLSLDKSNSV